MRCACSLDPHGWSLPERQPRINPGHRRASAHTLVGFLGLRMGLWLPQSPQPRGSCCAPGSAWASEGALHAAPSCAWLLSLLLPTSLVLMSLYQATQQIFSLIRSSGPQFCICQ